MKPLVIGITGEIGCGKSHVRETLVELGAEGIDADKVAHDVMALDGPAYEAILAAFGRELLTADGTIDRRRLAERVFTDAEALARLEQIVHPAVFAVVKARIENSRAPAVAIEAIKLLEAGFGITLCDRVWIVVCSEEAQIERLVRGRGMPADEVQRRLANQMPQEKMVALADTVIHTEGTLLETRRQVVRAWLELGLPAPDARVAGTRDGRLLVAVRMDRPETRALYERLGLTECGRLTEVLDGRYVDKIMYELPL